MTFLKNIRAKSSLVTAIIISVIILISHFNIPRYKYSGFTQELSWDPVSYYLYLPMTFIYHDPGMKTSEVDSLHKHYNFSGTLYQIHQTENNTRVPNYTCGMAYSYLPFFLASHLWAKCSSYEADGFSFPYQICISSGLFLIILPGIFLLRKLLIQWYSETVVALSLIIIFLGTNYFSEAIDNHLQPHCVLFTLYAILLLYTKKWHDAPSYSSMAIIGLTAGWITLTRPTDIICVLIPLLWGVHNRKSLIEKIKLIRTKFSHLTIFILTAFIAFIPQFIYWKATTGHFIYYSYKHTEGFDFLNPHIWNVLFSFKKSLFIYTPILILPLIGMFLLYKKSNENRYLIILFTIINFYLLSSWAVWWNGSSFGMRYFVQSYALLSIPLCITIEQILKLKAWRYIIAPVAFFLLFLNLFQTWQYVQWIMSDDRMNLAYYKAIFLKTFVTREEKWLMEAYREPGYTETFDNEQEYNHHTVAYYNFEDANSTFVDDWVRSQKFSVSPPNSLRLSPQNIYYPTFKICYDNLVRKDLDHVWLRVSLKYYSEIDIKDNDANLVINFPHNDYNQKYRAFSLSAYPFEIGKWNSLKIDYMTPYPYSEKDSIEVYMWYRGNSELFVDDLRIDVYEKK